MSPTRTPPYIVSGPDSIKAATARQREVAQRDQWPFYWCYPPPNSLGKRIFDAVAIPTVLAGLTTIVEYRVPSGMKFILWGIVIGKDGGAYVNGRGDALFSLTVNAPATPTAPQGYAVDGFNEIPFLVGSLTDGPYPLGKAEIFRSGDIVRIVGVNVLMGSGDPNYWYGSLVGWIMPD